VNAGFAAFMGEIVDGITKERPATDRKQKHEFRDAKPARDCPCVVPGCGFKFRATTNYYDFVAHYEQHHQKLNKGA